MRMKKKRNEHGEETRRGLFVVPPSGVVFSAEEFFRGAIGTLDPPGPR